MRLCVSLSLSLHLCASHFRSDLSPIGTPLVYFSRLFRPLVTQESVACTRKAKVIGPLLLISRPLQIPEAVLAERAFKPACSFVMRPASSLNCLRLPIYAGGSLSQSRRNRFFVNTIGPRAYNMFFVAFVSCVLRLLAAVFPHSGKCLVECWEKRDTQNAS